MPRATTGRYSLLLCSTNTTTSRSSRKRSSSSSIRSSKSSSMKISGSISIRSSNSIGSRSSRIGSRSSSSISFATRRYCVLLLYIYINLCLHLHYLRGCGLLFCHLVHTNATRGVVLAVTNFQLRSYYIKVLYIHKVHIYMGGRLQQYQIQQQQYRNSSNCPLFSSRIFNCRYRGGGG